MNTAHLQTEILKALRGSRSQMQVSRRLGYKHNQVYRWESATTRFHWADFARLCKVLKIDLARFLNQVLAFEGRADDGAALTAHLLKRASNQAARELGVSRFKLQRWAGGKSEVPFEQILKVLHMQHTLLAFATKLATAEQLPSLAPVVEKQNLLAELFTRHPALGGVLHALDLQSYAKLARHQTGWIAHRLGITSEEEIQILDLAQKAGVVERSGGKFRLSKLDVSTIGHPEAEHRMRNYWIERGIERDRKRLQTHGEKKGHFGFLITALSDAQNRRLRDAYVRYINEVRSIVTESSTEKSELVVLTMQLFDL